ncbi:Hypothetical Protein FCC1311_023292 [Hondaea fermentalgiana]|uniref:Uncharacterized protein n=1 Tax=Hondaea fermentalgiana TaxID=2315210 RepID=A0A2R5G715_9STRA|nr:Hypothetical Protein FCC1311_023292 [Hondaea fermentalgiana]|eukprot:GBG26109.1 Hypothetical Protein FCC1311_023292 [Hondaea fermentalgiana]
MSGGRPDAPGFAYPANGALQGGGFEDILQNVLYVSPGQAGKRVALEFSEGTLSAIEAGASARITSVEPDSISVLADVRCGPLRITPATDDTAMYSPQPDSISSNATEVNMEGFCIFSHSDLLASPVVAYTGSFDYDASSDTVTLFENTSLLYTSPGADYTGFVNNSTGTPENWNTTMWGSAPVFSQIAWFAFNCRDPEWYTQPWYALVFYDFPRILNDHVFVYPKSASYGTYLTSLLLTAPDEPAASEAYSRDTRHSRLMQMSAVSGHSSLEVQGLSSREKRKEALRLRQEIIELDKRLEKTLTPSSLPKRAFLIFLLVLALVEVPIGITLSLAFYNVLQEFQDGADHAENIFQTATALGEANLDIVENFESSCGSILSSTESDLVETELQELNEYLSLVNTINILPANLNFLGGLREGVYIVWQALNAFLCIMVLSSIWSGVLTYCRFTWGEEKVVCQQPSFCLGRCLRPLVIFVSCLSWVAIGLFVVLLSVLADACFRPSFVQVNTTVANYLSSAAAQDQGHIYNYQRVFTQELTDLNRTVTSVSEFNVGAYLSNCYTTSLVFNPYTFTVIQANRAHLELVQSLQASNGSSLGCDAEMYTTSGFYSDLIATTQCSGLGTDFGASIANLCIHDGMWQLFSFLVSLILFNIVALVVYSNSRELTPNLYRMHAGKELQTHIQQLQSLLRDLLQDQGAGVSEPRLFSHSNLTSIGPSVTGSSGATREREGVPSDIDVA